MGTENVAILFTDIVGSTQLSQRLTQELADQVRRTHFAVLRRAVAECGGREVKNVGDGLMVVFPTASTALACGVAMQQGVEEENRRTRHTVGLRVGISGGEVVREDGDYFGDPVVEASRLCDRCGPGQILVADIVRAMAGRRSRIECRPIGALELKGLAEPVPTVEVPWVPARRPTDAGTVALPARLAVRPSLGMVGRSAEAAQMSDAFKRVAADRGREVVLLAGEAGMGKTTLVAEAARTAFEAGAHVLFGHCEEELATPYQLFAEALGRFVAELPEERLLADVAPLGPELTRLVPAVAGRIPDLPPTRASDPDSERYLLFAAVVGLLSAVSRDRPVVLVLDDLQWADSGSLLLLRHLAASDAPMRLLVLGTYRDSELARADALVDTLAALRRQEGVSRVELDGLDDRGVVILMETAAGHELDDDGVRLAHAIYRETDGNPFFVGEVLRHLVEIGTIRQGADGRWMSEAGLDATNLPDSVREVIGSRVLRLGRETGRVLAVASVIGRDFDLDLLARATTTPVDELLDLLEGATEVALVREPADVTGRYRFAHALIQHTLYEDMGPNRRAHTHRLVAEALEDLCGDRPGDRIGELARHWSGATQPVDLAKAIEYARLAGDAALQALAPGDALGHYGRALELLPQAADPEPALGIDLAIGLGTAQRQVGDPAFRETLLDAAHRAAALGDTDRLVTAALANDRGWYSSVGVVDTAKVVVLEQALDRLVDDHPDRALLLAQLCSELTWGSPLGRRQSLADEALAIAGSAGDDVTMVRVLNHVCFPLFVPPMVDQVLERTAESKRRAALVGDSMLTFWSEYWRVCVTPLGGDIEERDRCFVPMTALAERIDQPMLRWTQSMQRTCRALLAGATDEAERLVTETLRIGTESGQPDASVIFANHLLGVAHQRGTTGDLIEIIEGVRPDMPEFAEAVLDSALAIAFLDAERQEDAQRMRRRVRRHRVRAQRRPGLDRCHDQLRRGRRRVPRRVGRRDAGRPPGAVVRPAGHHRRGRRDGSGEPLRRWPLHRPRPVRRGGRRVRPGRRLEPTGRGEVLRGADGPGVGEDVRCAGTCRRRPPGPGVPRTGRGRVRRPRLRGRRASGVGGAGASRHPERRHRRPGSTLRAVTTCTRSDGLHPASVQPRPPGPPGADGGAGRTVASGRTPS